MFRAAVYLFFLSTILLVSGILLAGRQGLLAAFILAFGMNIIAYFYGERILLWTYGARPLEGYDPYHLYKIVDGFCKKTGLPKPRIFLIPAVAPNAFALGHSVTRSSIVLTEGAVQHLNPQELEAVIAHVFAQIQNRDTAINEISATLGSLVMYFGDFFKWLTGLLRLHVVGRFIAHLFAPLSAFFVHLGLTRNRLFFADSVAAELTANPQALAHALWKMENYSRAMPLEATPATAHMFIVSPLENSGMNRLFHVHPLIEERIKKLTGRLP